MTTAISGLISIISALLVETYLTAYVPILGSFAGLRRSFNEGVAFGIRLPPFIQEVLIGIALLAVGVLAVRSADSKLEKVGFGLILGGGIANIIDRARDGMVTDMIQVGSFPIFNIADSCITVGVILLFLSLLGFKKA